MDKHHSEKINEGHHSHHHHVVPPETSATDDIATAKYVVIGNVDAGKSTFIGVMEFDKLDNGDGYARSLTTKVKHEIDSGRTSTHSNHNIERGNETTILVDLCGHEKYLKTTVYGVMGLGCHYGIVVVGANHGLVGMAKEHLGLLISNKIPFLTIVTKTDICPENIMNETKKDLMRVAKANKKEIIFFDQEEAELNGSYLKDSHKLIIETFQEKKINLMPVIMVSNKTGFNIKFVKELIVAIKSPIYLQKKGIIPKVINELEANYPPMLIIDKTYSVPGIGIVLSGTVRYKPIYVGQNLYLGPVNSNYIPITVKTIKNFKEADVKVLGEDEDGSIGIRLDTKGSFTREMFSKGQVVIGDYDFAMRHTCYQMDATVSIFNHPTTIKTGYQTVIHCGTIRQAGKFKIPDKIMPVIEGEHGTKVNGEVVGEVVMDANPKEVKVDIKVPGEATTEFIAPNEMRVPGVLRTGSREDVSIRFLARPEFLLSGNFFLFRDGKTKGMGKILSVTSFLDEKKDISIDPSQKRRARKHANKKLEKTQTGGFIAKKGHSKPAPVVTI